jgi:hypothetical protein
MADTPRKRGRPRKHPIVADTGTPELQRHRALRANGADPTLSEDPLALMAAKKLILPSQAEAGRYYAWLYRRAVRWPHLSTNVHYEQLAMNSLPAPIEGDDALQALARRLYRRGKRRLLLENRLVAEATENVAVFGNWPQFLHPKSAKRQLPRTDAVQRQRDAIHKEAVIRGLSALAETYGLAGRRAQP